jgi:hypothetical protein
MSEVERLRMTSSTMTTGAASINRISAMTMSSGAPMAPTSQSIDTLGVGATQRPKVFGKPQRELDRLTLRCKAWPWVNLLLAQSGSSIPKGT